MRQLSLRGRARASTPQPGLHQRHDPARARRRTLAAKQAILEEWDPEAPRGYDNFNPFERDDQGNACDTNGKFPGETAYMDPQRPDMNYMKMLAEKKIIEEILEQPKTQARTRHPVRPRRMCQSALPRAARCSHHPAAI